MLVNAITTDITPLKSISSSLGSVSSSQANTLQRLSTGVKIQPPANSSLVITPRVEISYPNYTRAEKQAICDKCPFRIPSVNMCGICKCFLFFKTMLNGLHCPIDKW